MKVVYKKKLENFVIDVDFKIPEKGITVLFGPSGSGKSSILNFIAGLEDNKNNVGKSYLEFQAKILENLDKNIKIKPWNRNIGYVFQDHRLFPNMTVRKNIEYGYRRRKSNLDAELVVEKFKIKPLLNQYPEQLSGGEKQRVAMVRALMSRPELLILDEPLAALDYQSRQELLPYIECIHQELTIPLIYVSHDIKEVLRLADYIVVIDQGHVLDKGAIEDLCIKQPLMTQSEGASFILKGIVTQVFNDEGLVEINTGNEKLLVTDNSLQVQQKVRVLIYAREVSLCLKPPDNSSILNCVPVEIENISNDVNGKLRVEANMDKQKIVAMISKRSVKELKLKEGSMAFAQFKATAMIK